MQDLLGGSGGGINRDNQDMGEAFWMGQSLSRGQSDSFALALHMNAVDSRPFWSAEAWLPLWGLDIF